MSPLVKALFLTVGLLLPRLAPAQLIEVEPNHPCPSAQNLGELTLPSTVRGSLASTETAPDADFFRLTAQPGARLRLELAGVGAAPLYEPLLGLYDAGCELQVSNYAYDWPVTLLVVVPADGVLVLGVADASYGFDGGGVGDYALTVREWGPSGSVRGRAIDARSGDALASAPSAQVWAWLLQCSSEAGCVTLAYQETDVRGAFEFTRDQAGQPIDAGTYRVVVQAPDHHAARSESVELGVGEDRDVGDLVAERLAITVSEIHPCADVPASGGICRYSMRLTNHLSTRLDGMAWSIVSATGTGSLLGGTSFQAGRRSTLSLNPDASAVVRFQFAVPGAVDAGAQVCAYLYVDRDDAVPYFSTAWGQQLFCVVKQASGALVLAPAAAMPSIRRELAARVPAGTVDSGAPSVAVRAP